jgi:hypothetical protein
MPPAQDDDRNARQEDRNARQIEALRRYVAELGTNREQRPEGETAHEEYDEEEQPNGRRQSPLLPWLVLTALLVAAALIGGVLIGAARENGQEAGAGSRSGSAEATTTTLTAPVASPECKTAVDRANRSLAAAVKVRGVLVEYNKVMDDLRNGRIDARQAAAQVSPYLTLGTVESDKFDSALAEYRKVVDKCTLRKP